MTPAYKNALLNISADAGADSRTGCFVNYDSLTITPLLISSPSLSKAWHIIPSAPHLLSYMADAPSFTRAWIHRERQLARRVLHFTSRGLVWECRGTAGASFASELLPGNAPCDEGLLRFDRKYRIGDNKKEQATEQAGGGGGGASREAIYQTWNDICEDFSTKALTVPTDLPIVLAGLVEDFKEHLPEDEYVAGLWRSTLPQSLLWHARGFKSENWEAITPSWSWLSTDSAIEAADRSRLKRTQHLIQDLSISPSPNAIPTKPSLQKQTALKLCGFLRKIRLEGFEQHPSSHVTFAHLSVFDMAADGSENVRPIGPPSAADDTTTPLLSLHLDSPPPSPPDPLTCFFLFLTLSQCNDNGPKPNERRIEGLLLRPYDWDVDGKEQSYDRIGTMTLYDMYALKMRYAWPVEFADDDDDEDREGYWRTVQEVVRIGARKAAGRRVHGDGDGKGERGGGGGDAVERLYRFDGEYKKDKEFEGIDVFEGLERLAVMGVTIV